MNKILKEILLESKASVLYFVKSNVYNIGVLINILCPYILLLLILECHMSIIVLMILPIILYLISSILKRVGNKCNLGSEVPIPNKRFTEEDEYGEITIKNNDVPEVILYLNEVENYLERKGKL